tara:strand:+ start:1476 stop:1769 length:294 start_codon:yes stop_codon:yes gene_type:complete
MGLTKETVEDKIEIVGDFKKIQIRTSTIIKDDGKEIGRSFHRKTLNPGRLDDSNNLIETDVGSESTEVKAIASTVWTQAVKDAWKAHLIGLKTNSQG